MHGRRGSKDSHHGRQAGSFFLRSASNSPHSVSHHAMLRQGEFPKRRLPFPHNLLSILFLGDAVREGVRSSKGWGAPRGQELQGAHTLVSWNPFNHLDYCCQRSGGKKKTWPPDFPVHGPLWNLQNNFLLSLNCLPYSWLWNHLVWLCWRDSNYGHFH